MGKKEKVIKELEAPMEETTPVEMDEVPEDKAEEIPVETKTVVASKLGVVNCDRLNIRAAANLSARVVKVLTKGTEITVRKTDDPEWLEYTGFGFVMSKFITIK